MISAVVAVSKNGVIGKENDLPWKLPADLKHFKDITTGNAIIMGRKTYESIGRPLPNRINIVITRNKDYQAKGCIVVSSLEDAVKAAKGKEALIIGGGQIFKMAMHLIDRIYFTLVDAEIDGDVYFPQIDDNLWEKTSEDEHQKDKNNEYNYKFITYEKKESR